MFSPRSIALLAAFAVLLIVPVHAEIRVFKESYPPSGTENAWAIGPLGAPGTDATTPEGDGSVHVVGPTTYAPAVSAAMFGTAAPRYPLRARILTKADPPAGASAVLRFGFHTDVNERYQVEFLRENTAVARVVKLEGGTFTVIDTLDISTLGIATGDWVRLEIGLGLDNEVTYGVERWLGTGWSAQASGTLVNADLTRDTSWRAIIEAAATTDDTWTVDLVEVFDGTAFPLPVFTSSDPVHDARLNDLFLRHARVDFSDTSLKRSPGDLAPGWGTVNLWRDWEIDMLNWYDFGPHNFPDDGRHTAGFEAYIATQVVDKFGYCFSANADPTGQPPTDGPSQWFAMGWPFPDYAQSRGESRGWEFNGSGQESWSATNLDSSSVSGGYWTAATTQLDPHITSPNISVDTFHAPFVSVDITWDVLDPAMEAGEADLQMYWRTAADPTWSEGKSVRASVDGVIPIMPVEGQRYRIWFPMFLYPDWEGQEVIQIRFDPVRNLSATPRSATWSISHIRMDYDSRHAINNPVYVRATARKFFWDGDESFLAAQLSKMRQATQFMLTHLQAEALNHIDQSWFVGHDGIGWTGPGASRTGGGIGGNYWDILPMGPRDMHTSARFYLAMKAMAEVEAFVEANPSLDSAKPSVIGPDGSTVVPYAETAASLAARLPAIRQAIHDEFWNPATGRYGGWRNANGDLRDYGFVHANLVALEAGIPDEASAASIIDWLSGDRIVAGDTSTGADIYHWEFAARATTLRNEWDYNWGWDGSSVPFGEQVQDGGAVLYTTFYDIKGRLLYGDVEGAWDVWERMLVHHQKVLDNGGLGPDFYREYYDGDPGPDNLQGGGTAGGLGLDVEFVESLMTPSSYVFGWVGAEAFEPGVLTIEPRIPPALASVGVENLMFRRNGIKIVAEEGVIDLAGSGIVNPDAGRVRLVFNGTWPANTIVYRDGVADPGDLAVTADAIILETDLGAARFELGPDTSTVGDGWRVMGY